MTEMIALHDGTILAGVHPSVSCWLEHCCIHNPSDHPLRDAPLAWTGRRIRSMNRVCEHGVQHPDPDDLGFKSVADPITAEAISSVHLMRENCDGCCHVFFTVDVPSSAVVVPVRTDMRNED